MLCAKYGFRLTPSTWYGVVSGCCGYCPLSSLQMGVRLVGAMQELSGSSQLGVTCLLGRDGALRCQVHNLRPPRDQQDKCTHYDIAPETTAL